ncbi:DUF1129 family protein [Miniphocaeibacter halophilus]|uniref:DUF1129 family protein n=1 Tax=Miniphocaeibacter halophilus TaxID=2931922 RepID=A0AC61N0S7_9FIRM|nr:DUF1129 family protein [Miniphocaeibacter halophilus]QQK08794.1 DUF1129 family protein [Miniphocaeibacter halophilus]
MKYSELKKCNGDLKFQLNRDYYSTYKDVEHYLRAKIKSSIDVEIILYDILIMFLDGQNRGEDISNIVGSVDDFGREILKNYPKPSFFSRLISLLYDFSYFILIYFLIVVLSLLDLDKSSGKILTYRVNLDLSLQASLFGLLLGGLIIFFLNKYTKPSFRKKYKVIQIIMIFIVLILIVRFRNVIFNTWFFKNPIIINTSLLSLIVVSLIIIFLVFYIRKLANNKVEKIIP